MNIRLLNQHLQSLGLQSLSVTSLSAWVKANKKAYPQLNIHPAANGWGDEVGYELRIPLGKVTYQVCVANQEVATTPSDFCAQLQQAPPAELIDLQDKLKRTFEQSLETGLSEQEVYLAVRSYTTAKDPDRLLQRIQARLREKIFLLRASKKFNIPAFHESFPVARERQREIIAVLGPTNSGKTHEAFQALLSAQTGVYLAPLRLMALEGWDRLTAAGVSARLLTGEERTGPEDATHISSTVEMLNPTASYDVAVIDEVQMLADETRGWAWTNAILGVNAKQVYVLGALEAQPLIELCARLTGEPLTIIEKKRLCPLEVTKNAKARKGTAYVSFSRMDVLTLKARFGSECAAIYGSLGPEVRRHQAQLFSSGEAPMLSATDAIGMGLNLPIETVVFTTVVKWDGKRERRLTPTEVKQIAGRAGRYGIYKTGYVTTWYPGDLPYVEKCLKMPSPAYPYKLWIAPHLTMLEYLGKILNTQWLFQILVTFCQMDMEESVYFRTNLEGMMTLAGRLGVHQHRLSISHQFSLCQAPINVMNPQHLALWDAWVQTVVRKQPCPVPPLPRHRKVEELQALEEYVKALSAYNWLSYRFSDVFCYAEDSRERARQSNQRILELLQGRVNVKR